MSGDNLFIEGEAYESQLQIQGWFSGLKKTATTGIKAIAKNTGGKLLKDLKPVLSLAKKVDPKLLMAINPAAGSIKLGFDLLKDLKTTQKETGKEISFGVDNVMKWYEIGFAKGVESQLKKVETATATMGTQQQVAANSIIEKLDDGLKRSRTRSRDIVRR